MEMSLIDGWFQDAITAYMNMSPIFSGDETRRCLESQGAYNMETEYGVKALWQGSVIKISESSPHLICPVPEHHYVSCMTRCDNGLSFQ